MPPQTTAALLHSHMNPLPPHTNDNDQEKNTPAYVCEMSPTTTVEAHTPNVNRVLNTETETAPGLMCGRQGDGTRVCTC
jgi:hypothetical protein